MKIILILSLLSFSVFAEKAKVTSTSKTNEKSVELMVKEGKKDRKKKIEMCHDCGKPESVCDCEGNEHKKDE